MKDWIKFLYKNEFKDFTDFKDGKYLNSYQDIYICYSPSNINIKNQSTFNIKFRFNTDYFYKKNSEIKNQI